MRPSLLIAGLLAGLPLLAQQSPMSNREEYGLHGPVHTVRTRVEKLATNSPNRSSFLPGPNICGNCVFDVRGDFLLQQSTDGNSKNVYQPSRYERDELGWPTKETATDANGKVDSLTIFRNGAFGPLETQQWVRGKLVEKEIDTYDERGHRLTSDAYDSDGNLTMGDIWRYDDHGNEIERQTRWATGESREDSRYDESGNLLEVVDYDTEGNVVLRATLRGSEVTSWWMKPRANFSTGFAMPNIAGKSVVYTSREDGRLEKSVSLFSDREGNFDPDVVLRYDPDGRLLGKVLYHYEWDSFNNWTIREVRVWDSVSGEEALIERASRAIQYY